MPQRRFGRGNAAARKWILRALPLAFALAAGAALPPGPAAAAVDPLQAAFNAAIANPANIELQLQYARAAEAAGKIEAAFPVYERVLALDPGNAEAKAGLRRIRIQIQPARSETFVEVGTTFETNPLHLPSGDNPELQLFANLVGTYERALGDRMWRTTPRLAGIWHSEQQSLNYAYAGALTGPLFDITPNAVLHTAIGGGVSSFSNRFFYGEVIGSLTLEAGAAGATQSLRARLAWRQYDPFWVPDSGVWGDLTAKFVLPEVAPGSAFVITPWARFSNVSGTTVTGVFPDPIDVTPGRYIEAGGQVQYIQEIVRGISGALNVSLNARQYTSDVVPFTSTARQDVTFSPGASLTFARFFGAGFDVRVRYNFILNDSNDEAHDYQDHVVSLGVGAKF